MTDVIPVKFPTPFNVALAGAVQITPQCPIGHVMIVRGLSAYDANAVPGDAHIYVQKTCHDGAVISISRAFSPAPAAVGAAANYAIINHLDADIILYPNEYLTATVTTAGEASGEWFLLQVEMGDGKEKVSK